MNEIAMRTLEEQIPKLAVQALNQAYYNALASGQSVLEAINGELIETRPDGTFRFLKSLPSPIVIVPGQRLVRMCS